MPQSSSGLATVLSSLPLASRRPAMLRRISTQRFQPP